MGQGRDDSRGYPADGTAAADPGALEALAAALTAMVDELTPPLQRLGAEALAYQLRPHPGGPDLGAFVEGTDRASQAAARLAAMAASVRDVGLAFRATDLDLTGRALRATYHVEAADRRADRPGVGDGLPLFSLVPPMMAPVRSARRDDDGDVDGVDGDRDDDSKDDGRRAAR